MWLCYACLVPILKGDLESTVAVLGVNVNYKIFKWGRTSILQKEYCDPLNKVEPWHDEPHCQAKGEARRILQRKDRIKTENEGQSIWQWSWSPGGSKDARKATFAGVEEDLIWWRASHSFFPSVLSSLIKMLSHPTDLVSEQPLCAREVCP